MCFTVITLCGYFTAVSNMLILNLNAKRLYLTAPEKVLLNRSTQITPLPGALRITKNHIRNFGVNKSEKRDCFGEPPYFTSLVVIFNSCEASHYLVLLPLIRFINALINCNVCA